jgi:ABC-type dipeptide/oligopeptide/nickel transport system permease component
VFALDGIGHLAYASVVELQQPLLMAIVTLGSLLTLAGLVLSDWLHRVVDARVRLS